MTRGQSVSAQARRKAADQFVSRCATSVITLVLVCCAESPLLSRSLIRSASIDSFQRRSAREAGNSVDSAGRFEAHGDGYRLTFIEPPMEFVADRLRWERDELVGQLTVSTGLAGARVIDDGCVSIGSFNFSSPTARYQRSKNIAERLRAKVDVLGELEELCQRVLKAVRRGQPAIVLRDVIRPNSDGDEYDVDGFVFPKHHMTIEFGDGGSGKSYHLLRTGGVLAQRGVRVALVDYELDEFTQRLRLEQVFGDDMPDVRYVRGERPLPYEVDRLRRIIQDDRIEFTLFDSLGFGCGGPPEAAEHAMAYARATRQLGVGSLHVAHIRQGDGNDQRPFGSAFWHNSARSTWFVKLAGTSTDGRRQTVGLFNRKSNLSALRPAVGFELDFDGPRVVFHRVNVNDVGELAESLPVWQRMRSALAHGPRTLASLADELGASVDTLDRTVRRKSGLFTRVSNTPDSITRIALVERRAS